MRTWNLKPGDPLSLIIAADPRVSVTDYTNDHIWELTVRGGKSQGLALTTTYGLRCRSMQMFPRFSENNQVVSEPSAYHQAPILTKFYPNYLQLNFSPFKDIDVVAEYWVPDSDAVAGRIQITNSSAEKREIKIDWLCQLTPKEGQPMALTNQEAATLLAGSTDGLFPVVFLTGGPQPGRGSFPSLQLMMDLVRGERKEFVWSHAAKSDIESSFKRARAIAMRNWDAEISRLDMLNTSMPEIYTGNPDWDAAIALSQKQAINYLIGPTPHLPHTSFVYTRLPDDGYSLKGDGSDYDHLWNGQTPLSSYYLSWSFLPGIPEVVEGMIRNFIHIQEYDGFIDLKPGLAGQRSRILASPFLASLTWRLYECLGDESLIKDLFPSLFKFFHQWFLEERDRDEDGIPEWDNLLQTEMEEHPFYSTVPDNSLGVNISTSESPALCAILHREASSLLNMADLLEQPDLLNVLNEKLRFLETQISTFWVPDIQTYSERDRDTHLSARTKRLFTNNGSGTIAISDQLEYPIRLLIRIHAGGEKTINPDIYMHGSSLSGKSRVEHITGKDFRWYLGNGTFTGERIYKSIDRVDIEGLKEEDCLEIYSIGYEYSYISNFLPLWANIPQTDQINRLIERTLQDPNKFWMPFGIPYCTPSNDYVSTEICQHINLMFVALIIEGINHHGYKLIAVDLFSKIMDAVIKNLKTDGSFRQFYDASTGDGVGERNILNGIVPVGLLLEILGVRILSPWKIEIRDENPFPWPVTIKFKGLTVMKQREKTTLIFPDGQIQEINDTNPQIIALE